MAVWSNDSQYYPAIIEGISNGKATVAFVGELFALSGFRYKFEMGCLGIRKIIPYIYSNSLTSFQGTVRRKSIN